MKGATNMNILLVEDIESIIKGLTYSLEKSNYKLVIKTTIKDTKEYLLSNTNIDLIIIDITLPDGNGFDLFVNTIKNLKIPTIFLTAKDEEDDIVKGLDIGAEDYITKPFSTREVIARINRILLRCKKKSIIKIKDVSYDMDKLVLMKNNTPIELTALELKQIAKVQILHQRLNNIRTDYINKVVSRNVILDKIWDWTGNYVDDHTVTVYFKRIREKIGTNIITTIKGMGYRIDEE
jgi:DNA-binding response OmpR family regulator